MTLDDYLSSSRLLRRLTAGPLNDGIGLYVDRLRRDGYGWIHARSALHILTHFARWLSDRRFDIQDIDEHRVRQFLKAYTRRRSLRGGDRSALDRLISTMRDAGIIGPAVPVMLTPHEQILEGFRQYLEQRRGVSATSAESYVWFMRRILRGLPVAGIEDLRCLTQRDVVGYVEQHADDGSAATTKILCSRFRSFLRYIFLEGLADTDLSACIPSIRRYSLTGLPTYLSAPQLEQVLRGCDRTTAVGKRDYAALMMLARLGLRAKEVATLTLDDVDWRTGQFLIRGKGRRRAFMPLPPDVGEALAAYLSNGRPASGSRHIFLRACPPHVGFPSAQGIRDIARRAIERAGIDHPGRRGSHIFRHSLATELLRSGATLTQIGQVLRHQHHDTTRIYAKVDLASLRTLILPWPGAGQ